MINIPKKLGDPSKVDFWLQRVINIPKWLSRPPDNFLKKTLRRFYKGACDEQYGNRKFYSIDEGLNAKLRSIYKKLEMNWYMVTLFLDLKWFFDMVIIWYVALRFVKGGVPWWLIMIVLDWWRGRFVKPCCNNKIAKDLYEFFWSVTQGGGVSMDFSLSILDELIDFLAFNGVLEGWDFLMWVDDLTADKWHESFPMRLSDFSDELKLLRMIDYFCWVTKLRLSKDDKCKYMVLQNTPGRGRKKKESTDHLEFTQLNWGDVYLSYAKQYTYLGTCLDEDLTLNTDTKETMDSIEKMAGVMLMFKADSK